MSEIGFAWSPLTSSGSFISDTSGAQSEPTEKQAKQFFFEKKNQKTFVSLGGALRNLRDSRP